MNFSDALETYKKELTKDNLEAQVDALLEEMILKEKVGLLAGRGYATMLVRFVHGLLFHRHFLYNTWLGSGCSRLGIPMMAFTDGGRGIVTGKSTCFPVPMLRAASFDPELEAEVGDVLGKEARVNQATLFGGICINLIRNPRWGRSQEAYGEDPFLVGRMGAQLVKSVQKHGLITTPKHFACNSVENLRFNIDVKIDERTLHEVYTPHFKKCVQTGAWAVMSAYNKVNGVYCGENKQLLTDLLREDWGFDGFVISDFMWGVHDTKDSLEAGCDFEMPLRTYHAYPKVKKLIEAGKMSEETVDRAAANLVRSIIRQQAACKDYDPSVSKSPKHIALAEQAALKGMVLLKNNGVLPLPIDKQIAVVGPFADRVNIGDHGSSSVRCDEGVTPYQGLHKIYSQVSVCSSSNIDQCKTASKEAEVVLVCVGCDHLQEGEFILNTRNQGDKKPKGDIGGDRESLNLRPEEVRLIKALKADGKQVVVALYTGSVILTNDFEEDADAIFIGYYGGVRAGDAMAKLISGQENFSGKLPVTIARKMEDYPEFKDIGQRPYELTYGYYHGYTLFDKIGKKPAYPFGFGLSYTSFEISNLATEKFEDHLRVTAEVRNSGCCDGTEVLQVYVGSNGAAGSSAEDEVFDVFGAPSRFDRPVKLLKGFQRVDLGVGESKQVEIAIPLDELRFYDPVEKEWILDPAYTVYAGNSSQDAMNRHVRIDL